MLAHRWTVYQKSLVFLWHSKRSSNNCTNNPDVLNVTLWTYDQSIWSNCFIFFKYGSKGYTSQVLDLLVTNILYAYLLFDSLSLSICSELTWKYTCIHCFIYQKETGLVSFTASMNVLKGRSWTNTRCMWLFKPDTYLKRVQQKHKICVHCYQKYGKAEKANRNNLGWRVKLRKNFVKKLYKLHHSSLIHYTCSKIINNPLQDWGFIRVHEGKKRLGNLRKMTISRNKMIHLSFSAT